MFFSTPSFSAQRVTRQEGRKKSDRFVVQFDKSGRVSELDADGIGHALTLQKQWIDSGADYVEIFRVLFDGSLNPTIGAYNA
tara:strand:+ start:568 stop:813 length:246 start_codon:yes stop_codon:yes gene_type:complete